MPAKLKTYIAGYDAAAELYITAIPEASASLQQQAHEIFSAIRDVLNSKNARIFQERVFAIQPATETISQIRSKVYGDIDDSVAPTLLTCKQGAAGPIAGVQVHAIICDDDLEVITVDQKNCGRIVRLPDRKYLALSGITANKVRLMLEKAESAIKQFGGDFLMVPRTWMRLEHFL